MLFSVRTDMAPEQSREPFDNPGVEIRKYNRCEGCGLADLASLDEASFVTCPDSTTGFSKLPFLRNGKLSNRLRWSRRRGFSRAVNPDRGGPGGLYPPGVASFLGNQRRVQRWTILSYRPRLLVRSA